MSVTSRVQMESLVNGLYARMDCSLMQLIKFATAGRSEYSSQYAQFNSLKTNFPGLKTLIAVGIHIMKY